MKKISADNGLLRLQMVPQRLIQAAGNGASGDDATKPGGEVCEELYGAISH
jgi:hypothetical protein